MQELYGHFFIPAAQCLESPELSLRYPEMISAEGYTNKIQQPKDAPA